jgi:hypothetical protein
LIYGEARITLPQVLELVDERELKKTIVVEKNNPEEELEMRGCPVAQLFSELHLSFAVRHGLAPPLQLSVVRE